MHREGHIGVSLAAYAPLGFLAYVLGFEQLAVAGGAVAIGASMLPDVDVRVPGLPHRGPTHTVAFAGAVGLLGAILGAWLGASRGGVASAVGLGLFGGSIGSTSVLAHLAADALTPMGIRPLEPWDDREVCLDVVPAANPLANYGLLVAGGAVALAALGLADVLVGAL